MPDSPATLPADVPPISSPGHIRIPPSSSHTRTPISIATALSNGYHPVSPNQPLSPGILNGKFLFVIFCVIILRLSKPKCFVNKTQQNFVLSY